MKEYELRVERQVASDYFRFSKPRVLSVANVGRGEIRLEVACRASSSEIGSRLSYEALFRRGDEEDGDVYALRRIEGKDGVFSFKPKCVEPEAVVQGEGEDCLR